MAHTARALASRGEQKSHKLWYNGITRNMQGRYRFEGRVNPSIREGGLYGYSTNCQTCVVVFEARLRGFDVEALPNNRNGYIRDLSYDTTLAWIDPQTGTKPMQISKPHGVTKERFLKGHVIEGRRYTLQFTHGRGRNGHIVCIERIGGDLRIYDPQNGRTYTKGEIRSYLSEKSDLRLTRVDNCAINPHYADFIMRKA